MRVRNAFFLLLIAVIPSLCYYYNSIRKLTIKKGILMRRECPNYPEPENIADDEKWTKVIDNVLYVYSAFNDVIQQPSSVRLVGLRRGNITEISLHCHLWYRNVTSPMISVNANKNNWSRDLRYDYLVAYISCPLGDTEHLPYAVTIATSPCGDDGKTIPIFQEQTEKETGPRYEFLSCVSQLYNRYDELVEIVEFIEMSKILGVGFFAFYNYSASPRINRLLNAYESDGSLSIRQYMLPDIEVFDFAKHASYFDCLYRNRYKAKYIIFLDMDELVFPINQDNLSDLFNSLTDISRCGEFSFRRKEFWKLSPDKNVTFPIFEEARKVNSSLLFSVQDMGTSLKKVVVDPLRIIIPQTHLVLEMVSGFKRCSVDVTDGLVFHYRVRSKGQVFSGIDNSIHRYSEKLISALKYRWNILRTFNVTVESRSSLN